DGLGCSKVGPLFPATYSVSEVVQAGYVNIGTIVVPESSRAPGNGTSPDPSNPIGVILTLSQAQSGSGPTVTFVNFPPRPILKLSECGYTNTTTRPPIHADTSRVTVYTEHVP